MIFWGKKSCPGPHRIFFWINDLLLIWKHLFVSRNIYYLFKSCLNVWFISCRLMKSVIFLTVPIWLHHNVSTYRNLWTGPWDRLLHFWFEWEWGGWLVGWGEGAFACLGYGCGGGVALKGKGTRVSITGFLGGQFNHGSLYLSIYLSIYIYMSIYLGILGSMIITSDTMP